MKINIIVAGVGGQGALSIATIVAQAALHENLYVKQSEVHGMSQRGGSVYAHLRISDKPLFSDLVPKGEANLIISMEPMECLRYLPFLHSEGWLITSSQIYGNIVDYPNIDEIHAEIKKVKNHILVDTEKILKEIKAPKAGNIVILGAASKYLGLDASIILKAIDKIFAAKGQSVIDKNRLAFDRGYSLS